jgi:hypothetical protein
MRRTLLVGTLTLVAVGLAAAAARADVIVRGPFGGRIVVASPTDVYVGPGVLVGPPAVVVPAQPPPVIVTPAPVVVTPAPIVVTPAPVVPVAAITPRDFAQTFKAVPGTYTVTFLHPVTEVPVPVTFTLPQGQPRVLCVGHSLIFDYGKHEVEIRFKLGGKVVVNNR